MPGGYQWKIHTGPRTKLIIFTTGSGRWDRNSWARPRPRGGTLVAIIVTPAIIVTAAMFTLTHGIAHAVHRLQKVLYVILTLLVECLLLARICTTFL